MVKNEASLDRVLRILIALIIVILYSINIVGGTLGIILLVVAGIMFFTGLLGNCPIYSIFGISTCKNKTTKKTEQ